MRGLDVMLDDSMMQVHLEVTPDLDWIVEQLFRTSAFIAFFATLAITGWLRDRGARRKQVKILLVLASINCVLAVNIVGFSHGELESLGYEFLLPFFVAISIGIMASAGYISFGISGKGRLIAVCVLWLSAAASFVSYSWSEYFVNF
jgi:hypothetical protein